ncbi:TPT-domain-containing protein [Aspergillus saccharolyticus JOP 1030-1]|uniref:TPT-domain-containing protein n=1 Tax=Aspergillus saccharolyticus JOP 1030-1 TaxID=1450539 RepID=A0A318ZC10_9EURO|nr:TPT-domain-containing protein [Aspergillus saccharolyticus JOP 1030-1]PYH41020.1 TPT-domain-containing protein [Aspergillus saccharolyticus JOP 1030-1]
MIRSGTGCQWFTRRRLQLSLACAVVLACIYTLLPPAQHKFPFTSSPSYARSLSPRELLSRPRSTDLVSIPKLIHQTWFPAGSNMSENAQMWVQTMRAQNPEWEYVLWDDKTNRLLVETHFPWFLKDYDRLPKEIHRADVVRNLYMFLFGGMYADVDTEALRPVDALFAGHDTPLRAAHSSILGSWTGQTKLQGSGMHPQRAFLGHMAHRAGLDGPAAVPNGWMASPPGHPFWLLPVIHVIENPEGNGDGSVESLTGPTALSFLLHRYYEDFGGEEGQTTVRRHVSWVFWSNLTILFNKWLIESTEFPILLTTWHLVFATLATQFLAHCTPYLNTRHTHRMTPALYLRQIVPIGLLYSGSLVTSNMTYLYLNVSFIQMLKAAGPIVTLLVSWGWRVATPSMDSFVNILVIACSVGLAVAGEVQFVWTGVVFQVVSLVFDANRLVMIQVLLRPGAGKMDPLVTLYYSAPVCAATNAVIACFTELNTGAGAEGFDWGVVGRTGAGILLANAMVGFMLNVSIFVLIGKTSGLTMTLVSVPKNILLIICSIVIWGSPVSPLQVLGYGMALLGLLYYSLGWKGVVSCWEMVATRLRGREGYVKYEPV